MCPTKEKTSHHFHTNDANTFFEPTERTNPSNHPAGRSRQPAKILRPNEQKIKIPIQQLSLPENLLIRKCEPGPFKAYRLLKNPSHHSTLLAPLLFFFFILYFMTPGEKVLRRFLPKDLCVAALLPISCLASFFIFWFSVGPKLFTSASPFLACNTPVY